MKRLALIAGAAAALLSVMGAGAYFYLSQSSTDRSLTAGAHLTHNTEIADSSLGGATQSSAQMQRLLERLASTQDRIAQGDIRALAVQGSLLSEISEVLRRFKQADWKTYINIRGAFIYVLSGGDYTVLKPLVENNSLYEADRTLAEGIMEFAQGNSDGAKKLLSGIEPRSLDVNLVGPFALAQSSFYIGKDNLKAASLLDEARLASPHGAIEEAAVRRQIPILISIGESRRAIMLMSDYLRRFGNSIYAWKLYSNFAAAAAIRDDLDSAEMIDKLAAATSMADKKARIDLFLAIAAAALPLGKISLANAAAQQVLALGPDATEDVDRATLYAAAAQAPTTRAVEALRTLRNLTSDRFSGSDPDIHDAAAYIAQTVVRNQFPNSGGGSAISAQTIQSNAGVKNTQNPPEMSLVAQSVASADAALNEANRVISGNIR